MTMVSQPLPHLGSPMVGGVIVNQEDLLSIVALRQAVQKERIASAFKDVPMPIVELGAVQVDGPENLLRVPLARRRDEGLVSSTRPGLVETGILPETGLVGKQEGCLAISGGGLAGDTCNVTIQVPINGERPKAG